MHDDLRKSVTAAREWNRALVLFRSRLPGNPSIAAQAREQRDLHMRAARRRHCALIDSAALDASRS